MSVYLKVKIKSLAAEARIIRHEERKHLRLHRAKKESFYFGLHWHRVDDVRGAARTAHLAYGFIRGLPYASIEAKSHEPPNYSDILRDVRKFAPNSFRLMPEKEQRELVFEWVDKAGPALGDQFGPAH